MRATVYADNTLSADLHAICTGLATLTNELVVRAGTAPFQLPVPIVRCPETYQHVSPSILGETRSDDLILLFTDAPYENNYFWEAPDRRIAIVSLNGWEYLTQLPRTNGIVFFLCALVVRHLRIGHTHSEANTGCLNDFWRDKTGVDGAMRSAYMCSECLRSTARTTLARHSTIIEELQAILDQLSSASRARRDILSLWQRAPVPAHFDVFLCHNSSDKAAVRALNRNLKRLGIRTWLDEEQLIPGRAWQDILEQQIGSVKAAAVLVGASGVGP